MVRVFRVFGALTALGVILLRHPSACWAAETTDGGVTGTIYGGAGTLQEPNNGPGYNEDV